MQNLHDQEGQTVVEYVILLTGFTVFAVFSWHAMRPALASFYQNAIQRRSGIEGMRP